MQLLPRGVLVLILLIGCKALSAQESSTASELEKLKSLITAQQKALEQQQKTLEQQQAQILALQLSMAEQEHLLTGAARHGTQGATLVPAVIHVPAPVSNHSVTTATQTQTQAEQAMS